MKTNTLHGGNQKPALYQIFLIAKQELLGTFASKGGLFVTGIFILTWSWLLFYPIRFAAEAMNNPEGGSLIFVILGWLGLEALNSWSLSEFAVYWAVALYLFPSFSLLMSADQIISERNRGGLRFLTLRCSRGKIFLGRFIGHISIQACLLIATLGITYLLLLANNAALWLEGLLVLPLLFLNLILVVSPFVALMSLLSVVMNSVRIAILVATIILVLASMIINLIAADFYFVSAFNYLVPGIQISQMAQLSVSGALSLLWIPIFQSVCFLVLGYGLFKRQSI
jgi:ABC-type transport system involved in multi-copper enzyme maturation permease subunit